MKKGIKTKPMHNQILQNSLYSLCHQFHVIPLGGKKGVFLQGNEKIERDDEMGRGFLMLVS